MMVFILDSVLWGLGFQIYSKGVKMKEKINVTAISEKIRQISQEFYALDKRINIFSDTFKIIRQIFIKLIYWLNIPHFKPKHFFHKIFY